MTPVFCCGFECGVNGLGGPHWGIFTGTVAFSTSTVRTGSRSLRINPTATNGSVTGIFSVAATNVWVIRCYIYFATLPNTSAYLIGPNFSGTTAGAWFNSSDSKIYAGVDNAGGGGTGISVTTGQWYLVDVKYEFTSANRRCTVRVNGQSTGEQSAGLSDVTATTILLGSSISRTQDVYYDDIVVSNTVIDYPIGAGKVYHFVPTSDGTHNTAGTNDFEYSDSGTDITAASTDVYSYLDDVPMITTFTSGKGVRANAPLSTEYIQVKYGPAPGIPAFSSLSSGPSSVEVIVSKHAISTSICNIQLRLVDNATTNDVYNNTGNNGTTLSFARKHYALAPSGVAWNLGGGGDGSFNNLYIEYITSDANPDHYFNGTMIEAEFPEIVTRIPKPTSIGHPLMI